MRLGALLVAVLALALPGVASAQAPVLLPGNPVSVYASGVGTLQLRVTDGVFAPPAENAATAGLAIGTGGATYVPEAGIPVAGRQPVSGPALSDVGPGVRRLTSVFTIERLAITEELTYADGTGSVQARYTISNLDVEIPTRVGVLGDLSGTGTGVYGPAPPRLVGGRDSSGAVTGLREGTPWSRFQAGAYAGIVANFAGNGLNDAIEDDVSDHGVGVQWTLPPSPNATTRTVDVTWEVPLPATQPPPDEEQLPAPEVGKSVNALPKSGTVRIRRPGTRRFVTLGEGEQIPVGTTVDTRKGRVTLVAAANRSGGTATADFYDGLFRVGQRPAARPVTNLKLVEPLRCPKRGDASAAAKRKKKRRLWGNGSGRFRTEGLFSSATVRGTRWRTVDRCDSTRVDVKSGSVRVRDFVRRRTVIVRTGRFYVAKRKR